MRIFDAHCHLDQLPDPGEAVTGALQSGVERMLSVSEDLSSGRKALALKKRFPGSVLVGLGIHPANSMRMTAKEQEEMLAFMEENLADADAIGEIGLDFKYATTDEEKTAQLVLLDRQLDLAAQGKKPVNLHSRRSQRQVMEKAIEYTGRTGLGALLHWFTASRKLARTCAKEEVFISVGPSIFFPGPAVEVAQEIAEPFLLVETDSPVSFDGEPAEPVWAALVLERLAELRGIPAATLSKTLQQNFDRYLGIA